MSNFGTKIELFSSKRKWHTEILSESSCNIYFAAGSNPMVGLLNYVRVTNKNSSVQFVLLPGMHSVSDMSRFRHEYYSNKLLHRNSVSKGYWSILEIKTQIGFKYFPSYIRSIAENRLVENTFNEIMDDIISEYDYLE